MAAKVRHELVHVALDVPNDDVLLDWAATANKPLAGHVTFFETDRRIARETMSWVAGQCVGYHESFVSGQGRAGAYVCQLVIAAEKLVLTPGGPARPLVPAAVRDYAHVPPMPNVSADKLAQKSALFRESTWGVEPASAQLLQNIMAKRRVIIARPGSEDLAYLNHPFVMAEASCNDHDYQHIILRENPSKVAALEEFLHGTQQRLGLIEKLGRGGAEYHVKDFMVRHQQLLGLGNEDVEILKKLMEAGL